jgi:anti-sigma-K factor RskA
VDDKRAPSAESVGMTDSTPTLSPPNERLYAERLRAVRGLASVRRRRADDGDNPLLWRLAAAAAVAVVALAAAGSLLA